MKRKGVTPVIAIIMLLLIVVVMVGGVFAWMQTMQEDVEGAVGEQLEDFIDTAQEYVSIEQISCNEDVDPAEIEEVYIYNSHEHEDFSGSNIYIDGSLEGDVSFETEAVTELTEILDELDAEEGDSFTIAYEGESFVETTLSC